MKTISHIEEKPYIEFEKKQIKMSPEKITELMPIIKSRVDELIMVMN